MTVHSLLELPVELLEEIKSHLHDLRSHAYFAQTCTKINRLYNDDMWHRKLFAAGYSIPVRCWKESEAMWKDWAFAVVGDAELFEHQPEISGWVARELITRRHIEGKTDTKARSLEETRKDGIEVYGTAEHPVFGETRGEIDKIFLFLPYNWDILEESDG